MNAKENGAIGSKGTDCRCVVVTRRGGPEVLQVVEKELPEPGPGEVRVKVLAAGVSAYDLMHRRHAMPGSPKPPFVLGEDFVGVVDRLGQGVTGLEPGQRVGVFTFGESGGYAEYVCQPAERLVPMPAELDPAEAVCLVVNYLTAYAAMHLAGKAQRGERILVQGAAGGVGSALVELGRLAGLEVYGTASAYNHALVSEMGATPIDYRNENVVKRVRELTGDGVDVVFDPIGGARQVLRSYRCLRPGGRLVWFGIAASKKKGLWVIPGSLLMRGVLSILPDSKSAPLMPDLGNSAAADMTWYRKTLSELFALLAEGKLRPVVAERIPLVEAARAHELLERGGYAGKVVLLADA